MAEWSGQISASALSRDSNTLRKKSNNTIQEKQQLIDDTKIQIQLKYKKDVHEIKWTSKYRFYETDIRKIDDQITLIQDYKYTLENKPYYLSTRSMYQQDYRRAIDHEVLQTLEIGIEWLDKKDMMFSTSIGPAYHRYLKSDVEQDRNVELMKVVFTERFRWELVDDLAIIQQYRHQGDFDNYQFLFSVGIENRLISNTFLKLEYKIEEDTEVSYDNKAYYNRSLLTSIVYKF